MSRHVLSFCGCSWVMQGKCFKLFRHGRFCNCRWQSRTISFPLGSARMSKWVSNDGSTWNGDGTRYPCIGNSSRKISTLCLQQAFNSQLGPDSSPQQAFQPHNDLPKPPVRANAPDAAMHGPSSKLLPAGCQPEVQHENHGWGLKTTLKHRSVRPTMFFFCQCVWEGLPGHGGTQSYEKRMHTNFALTSAHDSPTAANLSQGPNRWVAPVRPASGISSAGLALEMCQDLLAPYI